MTTTDFFIFLGCFTLLSTALIYSYFFYYELKHFDTIENKKRILCLKYAGLIQSVVFSIGLTGLYFLTKDNIWAKNTLFLPFIIMAFLLGFTGLLDKKKSLKILASLIEISAFIGFVFVLPKVDIFEKINMPIEYSKILIGAIWFVLYKFTCKLNELEGYIAVQSFHIGFSFLLILSFFSFDYTFLIQSGSLLLPTFFVLAPLYYILNYQLPLRPFARNVFAVFSTGFSFYMFLTGNWGIALLMQTYLIFEIFVSTYRFLRNFIKRKKESLFFFQTLLEKEIPESFILSFILRRNILIMGLLLLSIYIDVQLQSMILALVIYLKLYLNVMNPNSSKSSVIDLVRQAKSDIKSSIKETRKVVSEIKINNQNKGDIGDE